MPFIIIYFFNSIFKHYSPRYRCIKVIGERLKMLDKNIIVIICTILVINSLTKIYFLTLNHT